jgi:hypothetical protein
VRVGSTVGLVVAGASRRFILVSFCPFVAGCISAGFHYRCNAKFREREAIAHRPVRLRLLCRVRQLHQANISFYRR